MKTAVIMDMFGCPNRCKHCWLAHDKNANTPIEDFIWVSDQFKNLRIDGKRFFSELIFNTWYREPDFSDDYQELWELEKRLSTTTVPRFDLASIWRLARDNDYAPWLKSLCVDCVQITLFGTEQNTDYFAGRRGVFKESMEAISVLLQNSIVPRIQMFPFSTTVDDFENLRRIFTDICLEERINSLGKEFTCFFNTPNPLGEGFNLEDIRISRNDIIRMPPYFIEKTLEHFKAESMEKLWMTESELLISLLADDGPLNDNPPIPAFMVTSDFNVYPNCGEIADWWCLGNIKADGVDTIVDNYFNRTNQGLKMNYELPVKYFAEKYGNGNGNKLYSRVDLVQRWHRLEVIVK